LRVKVKKKCRGAVENFRSHECGATMGGGGRTWKKVLEGEDKSFGFFLGN